MKLIYFYLFPLFPFPWCPFLCFIFTFSPALLLWEFFFFLRKRQRDTLQEDLRMDQAGILRKFIQGVKAMREGDEERGEDNFGSDFMVGQHLHHRYKPSLLYIYLTRPLSLHNFHLFPRADLPYPTLSRFPVSPRR